MLKISRSGNSMGRVIGADESRAALDDFPTACAPRNEEH